MNDKYTITAFKDGLPVIENFEGTILEIKVKLDGCASDIVRPLCPACGGSMVDFADPERDPSSKICRPRFVCKNKDCRKKMIGRGGNGIWNSDQFEDCNFRTGLWRVSDLKNSAEYRMAEIEKKTERIPDIPENRAKFK